MTTTIDDFNRFEIRIGTVLSSEKVEGAEKLIKLEIDFGTERRQIVVAMAEFFEPSHFVGKQVPVLTNIEPKKFKGVESQGMLLAIDDNGKPILLLPEKLVKAGKKVR